MLVAEEVAHAANKKLNFGDWDGEQDDKVWCRNIRRLVHGTDASAEIEVDDSDDDGEEDEDASHKNPSSATSARPMHAPRIETVSDSDDESLSGYASSAASSCSPSPTPSELDEIEKDPTLRVGQKKVSRPVYLAQLGEMIRPTSGLKENNADGEVTRIEVALNAAEELIRRKREYGTELGKSNCAHCD